MNCLGFDTSNYTTSAALFDGKDGVNCSQLLEVRPGRLGLRQSDAVFDHVRQLPELFARLMEETARPEIAAIGVSDRPRAVEGSYMPCFLAGVSMASVLASALGVPLHRFSHQQGHIAASLWASGRMDLLDQPHLAWHLSGGTTELLLVEPAGRSVQATCIGGTSDLAAGQLIDRTGQLLELPFPAGRALDALSRDARRSDCFRVRVRERHFSLSGVENQIRRYFEQTRDPAETAAFALRSIVGAVLAATEQARAAWPGLPVVFAGGVSANSLLREAAGADAVFCPPRYSTDNAMGPAVLAWRQEQ